MNEGVANLRLTSCSSRSRAGTSFWTSIGAADERVEITEAENGEEALEAIAKQRPDLILMDIQLPIMDGYTATRRIKADPALKSIPIIAVTSYALTG